MKILINLEIDEEKEKLFMDEELGYADIKEFEKQPAKYCYKNLMPALLDYWCKTSIKIIDEKQQFYFDNFEEFE